MKNTLKLTAIAFSFVLSSTGAFASGKLDWKACEK
jgi:hypothetical protein